MASEVMAFGRSKAQPTQVDAFEALFLAEFRRVRAIAVRMGLDPHEAEDVAQDVFAQFCRRHPAQAAYAAAWLHRAGAHLALNAIRTRKRRSQREERDAAAKVSEQASDPPNPAQAVEDAERRREVRAVMVRLSPRHAAVLALRHSGMSYAEVADSLGVPVAHIGTLLRRAELAFKKEYDHASSR